jgi:drug/metabolite transporter (DMT)-like permease
MTARRADVLLLAACLLWGVSFVIVKSALDDASPLTFVALRFTVAAVIFAPFADLGTRFTRQELAAGALLALLLGAGFIAQAAGLVYTTPSRSAFLVAISSVLAPPIALLALRERPRAAVIVALIAAAFGTWLLTAPGGGGLNRGDALTLITAAAFGAQIVAITALSRRHAAARLVWLEIVGTALLAGVGAPLVEDVHVHWTTGFAGALAFTAVGATVLALLWQLKAQREMSSTRAAVLFCSEALFAALTSWIVTGERLAAGQWLGGAFILTGMIVAEWPVARSHPTD